MVFDGSKRKSFCHMKERNLIIIHSHEPNQMNQQIETVIRGVADTHSQTDTVRAIHLNVNIFCLFAFYRLATCAGAGVGVYLNQLLTRYKREYGISISRTYFLFRFLHFKFSSFEWFVVESLDILHQSVSGVSLRSVFVRWHNTIHPSCCCW